MGSICPSRIHGLFGGLLRGTRVTHSHGDDSDPSAFAVSTAALFANSACTHRGRDGGQRQLVRSWTSGFQDAVQRVLICITFTPKTRTTPATNLRPPPPTHTRGGGEGEGGRETHLPPSHHQRTSPRCASQHSNRKDKRTPATQLSTSGTTALTTQRPSRRHRMEATTITPEDKLRHSSFSHSGIFEGVCVCVCGGVKRVATMRADDSGGTVRGCARACGGRAAPPCMESTALHDPPLPLPHPLAQPHPHSRASGSLYTRTQRSPRRRICRATPRRTRGTLIRTGGRELGRQGSPRGAARPPRFRGWV